MQSDSRLGVNGIMTIDVATDDHEGLSIAIQPDTRIVIAGYTRIAR